MRRLLLGLVAAIALSGAAHATGEIENLITDADRARLESFDKTRDEALAEARAQGSPKDVELLDEILARPALPFESFDMTGNWRCRTIKAGGMAGLVVYGWFKCRVTDDGAGWTLEKLTGSQRTKGRFFTDSDTRSTYLGSFAVNRDPFPPYGSGPDSDQVGYATRSGDNAFQIMMPAPRYESKLDILELRR